MWFAVISLVATQSSYDALFSWRCITIFIERFLCVINHLVFFLSFDCGCPSLYALVLKNALAV